MEAEAAIDPLMADPRYKSAVADMTAFGGARFIKTGFRVAGGIMEDKEIPLKMDEERRFDDFFYVVSKKSGFDPTRAWYMVLYLFVLLAECVGARVFHRKGDELRVHFGAWLGLDEKPEEKGDEKQETEDTED